MATESSSPIFSWQFIAFLAAVLGLAINQASTLPLSPSSDGQKSPTLTNLNRKQSVVTDSRLWADPFEQIPKQVDDSSLGKSFSNICIMPVIVRADADSAEAREMRIRYRIAVASGLGAEGFVPGDPNHLIWINLQLASGLREAVPLEWFQAGKLSRTRKMRYEQILVIWIPDNLLFSGPFDRLAEIRTQVEGAALSKTGHDDFKVIGPYWSGTLVDMLNSNPRLGQGMTFYSCSATMADGALELLSTKPSNTQDIIGRRRLKGDDTAKIVNLTCTDEQFAAAFIDELDLRGIDPSGENSRIAIISNWDTEYGRVLPLTFAAKLLQWKENRSHNLPALGRADFARIKSDDPTSWPKQVLRAYYLSGVEGTLSAESENIPKSVNDDKTAPGSHSSAISLQRAEGEHQVDYIARLGQMLSRRIQEQNEHPVDQGKLVAIGVLGTDVYDKLLLIQSLRPLFKDAVFFTDSLDARFLDPVKAIPFTRNLFVASSYGFELSQSFQGGAPPFRSSEQTGAFLAVRTAVSASVDTIDKLLSNLSPQRFEIGRTYPVPLKVPRDKNVAYNEKNLTNSLYPPQAGFFPTADRFKALYLKQTLFSIACAFFLCITLVSTLRGSVRLNFLEKPIFRIIVGGLVGISTIILFFCFFYDEIEPATWIQGVSLWPSEFFRLAAFIMGAGSLLYCHHRVKRSRENLQKKFGIPSFEPTKSHSNYFAKFIEAINQNQQSESDYIFTFAKARRFFPGIIDDPAHPSEKRSPRPPATLSQPDRFVVFESIWRQAVERSTVFARNARTTLMAGCYFLFMLCVAHVVTFKGAPHRGSFSLLCDRLCSLTVAIELIYLMFWVVDETHLCLRFIKKLGSEEPTLWPIKAYASLPSLRPRILDSGIFDNSASPYIDVCFIGQLSQEAVPLIILPFIMLTIMIVARWKFFADWQLDPCVLVIYFFDCAICVYCAINLRNAAVAAKEYALTQIALAIANAKSDCNMEKAEGLTTLEKLMHEKVQGAFVPWHQQPFVSALLIPFGGSTGLGLIEFLLSRA